MREPDSRVRGPFRDAILSHGDTAMASDKKRRKEVKAKQKATRPAKPFVHPDGDRRRRGGLTADQGIADKRARQTFTGGVPDEPPGG